MATEATVLIPTHEHGRLLGHACASALGQTVSDIEVFIVGDGADDETRQTAQELAGSDPRVRFFDNPKGPRQGEVHRDAALQEAAGRIVCYLADDDLWMPSHVGNMLDLLDGADFAHAVPVGIRPDGSIHTWVGHLEVPTSRDRVINLRNFIPLSCGAHTLDFYRRLPEGWRTTPDDVPTDVYMWSQLLSAPDCVARSGDRITVLHFPSPWRSDLSLQERVEELAEWRGRMAKEGFELEMTSQLVATLTRHRATMDNQIRELNDRAIALKGKVQSCLDAYATLKSQTKETIEGLHQTQNELATREQQLEALTALHAEVSSDLAHRDEELASARHELEVALRALNSALEREDQIRRNRDMMLRSLTWRTRNRLLKIPGLAGVARLVGRARARRAGS